MYNNFFLNNNNYLDNKVIFLIANNPSIKNIDKIKNCVVDDNSVVIRFNGDPKKLLAKIFVNRCDVMFYRSNKNGDFNNFNKNSLNRYKHTVFTKVDNTKQLDINNSFKKTLNKLELENYNFSYLSNNNSKLSPTTGFGVLENIIDKVNYSKLVLIGFTNLTRLNVKKNEKYGCHSLYNENQYFQNYIIKNHHNIETI